MKKSFYTMLASVSLALAACNSQPVAVDKAPIKKEIGVQLYSVRELIGNPDLFAQNLRHGDDLCQRLPAF